MFNPGEGLFCQVKGLCPSLLIWQLWAPKNMLGCLFPQHGRELMVLSSSGILWAVSECYVCWKPLEKWIVV